MRGHEGDLSNHYNFFLMAVIDLCCMQWPLDVAIVQYVALSAMQQSKRGWNIISISVGQVKRARVRRHNIAHETTLLSIFFSQVSVSTLR